MSECDDAKSILQRLARLEAKLEGLKEHLDSSHADIREDLKDCIRMFKDLVPEIQKLKEEVAWLKWVNRAVISSVAALSVAALPPFLEHYLDLDGRSEQIVRLKA